MVVIDQICHVIWKRTSAPWGSFRTPRRERLMADIAIMSMLYESTAIVSVTGFLYLYQFMYLKDDSLLELLQSFGITTSVQLLIEWFFMGSRYHQKYEQYKQSRINRNGLNVLCYLVQVIWK